MHHTLKLSLLATVAAVAPCPGTEQGPVLCALNAMPRQLNALIAMPRQQGEGRAMCVMQIGKEQGGGRDVY